MNFKQQLQEAYEAGYRQSLQEAFDDAHEAYERGEINEEQLDEIVGLIARGITNAPKIVRGIGTGIKKGYDFTKSLLRRPVKPRGTPGASSLRNRIYGDGNKFKPMDPSLQKAFDDALGLKPGPITPVRPPITRTPSDIARSNRAKALRKYFDEPGSISDDELRALGIRIERPPVDLDDALFGPLGP